MTAAAPSRLDVLSRVGSATESFECCSTTFEVQAAGFRAGALAERARETARDLEAQLNAFDDASAVAELNDTGAVTNRHVARLVERAEAYRERTDGRFDYRFGAHEHALKAYLRGDADHPPEEVADPARVTVDGDTVRTDAPVDVNGIAKGYIVDRATDALRAVGATGFVNGGGDVARPTGPVGIEDPGSDGFLAVVDTDWNVATSGGYRRVRDGVDHVYRTDAGERGGDGAGGGARHDSVTVLAERDCAEADVLATTLCTLPVADAVAFTEEWAGAEALVVHGGVFHRTTGWSAHAA